MFVLRTLNGAEMTIDENSVTRVTGPYPHDTGSRTYVYGIAHAPLVTAEDAATLAARLAVHPPLLQLTRPNFTPVWVKRSAVTGVRAPLRNEAPDSAKAVLLFGDSQQAVIEDAEVVLERLNAEEPMSEGVLAEIREALVEIKSELPTMAATNAVKSEIHADIIQIEAESERPIPRRHFMKLYLESLRDNLAKAAGAGTAAALATAVAAILAKYFGVL